jgi:hypothetical protein
LGKLLDDSVPDAVRSAGDYSYLSRISKNKFLLLLPLPLFTTDQLGRMLQPSSELCPYLVPCSSGRLDATSSRLDEQPCDSGSLANRLVGRSFRCGIADDTHREVFIEFVEPSRTNGNDTT